MLFKPMSGDSSRISTDVTPYKQGYAYFTTDDGGFYVDADNRRIRVGASKSINATLASSGWDINKTQTISVSGLTADQSGSIGLASSATDEQEAAAVAANLCLSGQADGSLTVKARGALPTIDIPVTITMLW